MNHIEVNSEHHRIRPGMIGQTKFDGMRAIFSWDSIKGMYIVHTRHGHELYASNFDHITYDLLKSGIMNQKAPVDGELMAPSLGRDHLFSLVQRKKRLKPMDQKAIKFAPYDRLIKGKPYHERFMPIYKHGRLGPFSRTKSIIYARTMQVNSKEHAFALAESHAKLVGIEGLVVKSLDGVLGGEKWIRVKP